jgi:hypothetical protein
MQTTIGYCALSVIVFETVLADGVNEKKIWKTRTVSDVLSLYLTKST